MSDDPVSEDPLMALRAAAAAKVEAGVLLSIDEAAARLGISRRTLQDHVRCGDIRYIAVGKGLKRRRRRFHQDDLDAFIAGQRTQDFSLPVEMRTSSRRRNTQAEPVYGDFLAERAARIASGRSKSEAGRRHPIGFREERAARIAAREAERAAAKRPRKDPPAG